MSDTVDRSRIEPIPDGLGRKTRVFASIFVVTTVAFWLFAFSPWAREIFTPPDKIEDQALIVEIEGVCAAARARTDLMPPARLAETPSERAEAVEGANSILTSMVTEIDQIDAGTPDDQRLLRLWLADWEIYLSDRSTHVERLQTEGDVRFLTTEQNGIFINDRMNGFARVNNLNSCETPGDI